MSVLESFKQLKAEGTKIVVVTSHEYWSAKILNDTDINGILIGDDLNMVVHGHEDTLSCDVETIAMHTRAVKKGAKDKFLIAGMPFMANRKGLKESLDNVEILIKAGANALKIEGVDGLAYSEAEVFISEIEIVAELNVEFGEDYIGIYNKEDEVVYWHRDEWEEDSDVVFSIGNAILLATTNPKELLRIL